MEGIAGDVEANRRAHTTPAGEQRIEPDRVHHGAGNDVPAQLGGLFHHRYGEVWRKLFQPDGGAEAGGTGPDDDHVGLEDLAVSGVGQGLIPFEDGGGKRAVT